MNASAILKIGGSLLGRPHFRGFPERLRALLGDPDLAGERPLILCGGGDVVDVIRDMDSRFRMGEEASHWIAVRALAVTTGVVEALLPETRRIDEIECRDRIWEEGHVPVANCHAFLTFVDERRPDPLPRRWEVTSDSIAARLAECVGARRLVLLKSTSIPLELSLEEAAAAGFVDPYFPVAARGLEEIVAVNLRRDPPAISRLG